MIEAIVTATITVASILLFCYWFRYTCQLILSATTSRDYATNVARSYQLGFQEIQQQLSSAAMGMDRMLELDRLKVMLDSDYAVLARMMENADGIEQRMLAIHYSLSAAWYKASSKVSPAAARKALEEMSMVVAHFANSIGEAAACPSAA